MENVTVTYKVYKFAELEAEAKEKAMQSLYEINIDHQWWENDDIYNEIAKDYGIDVNMMQVSFDLDRENYVAFDTFNHSYKLPWSCPINVIDVKKFCKKAGVKYNKEGYISINHNHYAGGMISNYIEAEGYDDNEEALNDCLQAMLDDILTKLHADFDYLTSEKAIIETIEANDWTFFEDGKMANL